MYLDINCLIIGIKTSPKDIAISSISDFSILYWPVRVSSCIAAISVALDVPVIDAVISLIASPPLLINANIPGPPLAPNTSIACEVVIPASPSLLTISAKSFVDGFNSSTDNPSSSKTANADEVGFIKLTSACLKVVPAVEPS